MEKFRVHIVGICGLICVIVLGAVIHEQNQRIAVLQSRVKAWQSTTAEWEKVSNRFERNANDAQGLTVRALAAGKLAQSNGDRFEKVANDLLKSLKQCVATEERVLRAVK